MILLASILLWPIIWPIIPRKGKAKPVVKQGFVISQSARAVARANKEKEATERFVASL